MIITNLKHIPFVTPLFLMMWYTLCCSSSWQLLGHTITTKPKLLQVWLFMFNFWQIMSYIRRKLMFFIIFCITNLFVAINDVCWIVAFITKWFLFVNMKTWSNQVLLYLDTMTNLDPFLTHFILQIWNVIMTFYIRFDLYW